MKKLINKFIEYLEITIQSKKNMRDTIVRLEKELKEAKENEEDAIKQMNKYKKKILEIKRNEIKRVLK